MSCPRKASVSVAFSVLLAIYEGAIAPAGNRKVCA